MNDNKKYIKDQDPIESKKNKKPKLNSNKFDPSRKNKKYYIQKSYDNI